MLPSLFWNKPGISEPVELFGCMRTREASSKVFLDLLQVHIFVQTHSGQASRARTGVPGDTPAHDILNALHLLLSNTCSVLESFSSFLWGGGKISWRSCKPTSALVRGVVGNNVLYTTTSMRGDPAQGDECIAA